MNKSKEKTPMSLLNEKIRINSFSEVSLGYTKEEALLEADRCLQCKHKPCVDSCPVGVPIPEFIQQIKDGNLVEANKIIKTMNAFPRICGRVCPQEKQCEMTCVRAKAGEAVAIGRLERYVGDNSTVELDKGKLGDKKVAIVGSGPAGLACAYDLIQQGINVTVYEVLHTLGGVLKYGIPEFRLPNDIVEDEIKVLKKLGVKFETNTLIGRTYSLDELMEDYDAVFVGSGAGLPKFLGLPGENLSGVYSANEFLTRVNLLSANKEEYDTPVYVADEIVIVGGGNVAMDAARVAKRLGSKVNVVYRRSMEELPARAEEVEHAIEEDINFRLLRNPVEIVGDDNYQVKEMKVEVMELSEAGDDGRRKPMPTGKFETIKCDAVVIAIGTTPNPLISSSSHLDINKWGCLVVNEETLETSRKDVYAGGDAVTGAATVILAMGAGKQAAASIIEKLK